MPFPSSHCVSLTCRSLALATDQLVIHRLQLAVVTAIAVVFAVQGTEFIFQKQGALVAIGVGWLLTTMVDVSLISSSQDLLSP